MVSYFEGLPRLDSTLVRVPITGLDQTDLDWLEVGLKTWPQGYDLDKTILDIASGMLQLWRFDDGIMLTQILQHAALRELRILTVAGKGYLRKLNKIEADLREIAKEKGCHVIGGDAINPALTRIYLRFGATPRSVYFMKGVLDE